MKRTDVLKMIGICFLITAVIAYLLFFLLYIISAKRGDYFNISVIYIFAGYVLLYSSLFVFLLRVIRIIKSNKGFLYLFLGTANISVWLICIVLFLHGKSELWWLQRCYLNLIMGAIILGDSILFIN
jgi:hypothetical protein